MRKHIQVHWIDRRGAYRMRLFSSADAAGDFMSTLRVKAVAKDDAGEIVGEVYRADESLIELRDRRQKWLWYIEL
jgi:gamma-glutamylcyclotransferase (GGCT)/AIG2-like uncharacterized protein YtfP